MIDFVADWCVNGRMGGGGVGGLLTLHSVALIVHFKGTFRPKQAACHSLVRVCDMLGTSADQFAETQSINRFKTTVNHQDARQVVTACFKLEHKTEPSDHKWSIRESEFTCCESDQQMIGQRDVTSGCVSPKVEFISSSSQQLAFSGAGIPLQFAPLQPKWNTFNWIASEDVFSLHRLMWSECSLVHSASPLLSVSLSEQHYLLRPSAVCFL